MCAMRKHLITLYPIYWSFQGVSNYATLRAAVQLEVSCRTMACSSAVGSVVLNYGVQLSSWKCVS